jgi:signal transduction histidine kinase
VEVEVRDESDLLGRIWLVLPTGRGLVPAERRLLDDFATHAALALRTLRLDAELRSQAERMSRHAEALALSRRRLLAARDDERRRTAAVIERQVVRHLRPIPDAVAQVDLTAPTAAATSLRRLEQAVEAALDALREVTHGVYPAVLSSNGLAAALRGHAGRIGRPGALSLGEGVADLRYPPPVETAAYFCAAALLMHVDVLTVSADGSALVLEAAGCTDSGDAIVDRVEAAGGTLARSTDPDGRSTLRVELPAQPLPATSAQTASSRSLAKDDLAT